MNASVNQNRGEPNGSVAVASTARATVEEGALVVDRIRMEFDGRVVLHDVSLVFEPGTVHGLIGHNGSGKSTLVKILAGYYRAISGVCSLAGARLPEGSPSGARQAGLRFVHQDLGLIPQFSALENFGIGGEYAQTRWRALDWKEQARRMRDVFEILECPLPPKGPVSAFTAVERSLVAIARAIGAQPEESGTRFIVLDEPTTALEGPEAEHLFSVVRSLKRAGIGTILVSHQLTDVLNLCSAITVLRDGVVVGTLESKDATRELLVETMLGPETAATELQMERRQTANSAGSAELARKPPALAVRGLRSRSLRGVDLDVAAGECVFVVGLAGSGRDELVYAVTGAIPADVEQLTVSGADQRAMSPAKARRLGLALVPGNRLPGSLVSDFAMRENLTFASLEAVSGRLGTISRRRETDATRRWIKELDIKPGDVEFGSRYMSGGNKQKVVMAKWLSIAPSAMLVDEPTAGVDVGAVIKLFDTLRAFVAEGGALLVSSSELEDALALADRIIVLHDGHFAGVFVRGVDEFSEQALLLAMVHGAV